MLTKEIPTPIDLLKSQLAILEKAIDKTTVANYFKVRKRLNPQIAKYKHSIVILEAIENQNFDFERGVPFDDSCFNPKDYPAECRSCPQMQTASCNTCKVLNPKFDGV